MLLTCKTGYKYLPMKQFLIVESSELAAHPAAQLQRVKKFLNVKPFLQIINFT